MPSIIIPSAIGRKISVIMFACIKEYWLSNTQAKKFAFKDNAILFLLWALLNEVIYSGGRKLAREKYPCL
jgi:hypothetical protein